MRRASAWPVAAAGLVVVAAASASAQPRPVGERLAPGLELVYASGGTVQAPWVYDSVVYDRSPSGYQSCVRFQRRGQPPREVCVRGDTLFEGAADGRLRPSRPAGSDMRFVTPLARGGYVVYETGQPVGRRVDTTDLLVIPTVITTHDSAGVAIRRLREEYAPGLVTAVEGTFEEPDPEREGAWRMVREFRLVRIRAP
jgi:hypothetical protein